MRKKIIVFQILVLVFSIVRSQSAHNEISRTEYSIIPNKEISIGDQCPDLQILNIINFSSSKAKISDFRGKLLILDFWATWCAPCMSAFPKLASLQSKYSDKIQILSVTSESPQLVTDFLKKYESLYKLKIPSAVGDKILSAHFKHKYLPHYVWIDSGGVVMAITNDIDIKESHILNVLEGKKVDFGLKRDSLFRIVSSPKQPLFRPSFQIKRDGVSQARIIADSSLLMQSILGKYIEGQNSTFRMYPTVISAVNCTVRDLYQIAFFGGKLDVLNSTSTAVEINDSTLFEKVTGSKLSGDPILNGSSNDLPWMRTNLLCYELKVPETLSHRRYEFMLAELNRFFDSYLGIKGYKTWRLKKYLSLSSYQDTSSLLATLGHASKVEKSHLGLKIVNGTLQTLITSLSVPLQLHPMIIDETSYNGNIDIELNCDLSNLAAVNNELSKFGLILKEKQKKMEVGVIEAQGTTEK